MPFHANTSLRTIAGREMTVVELAESTGAARAELWPEMGGNCVRWQIALPGGSPIDLLYAPDPEELLGRPTRGGIPVLFPFPNRIRAGRFTWAGRGYQLPLNDSTQQNAIHGFTPRRQWRVLDTGANNERAWAKLEFLGSRDAPDCRDQWPADYRLTLMWELNQAALTIRAHVENADAVPLPFGLGFHPYFRVTAPSDQFSAFASARWELNDGLPTGTVLELDEHFDLRKPRAVESVKLDDVYTNLNEAVDPATSLRTVGRVERAAIGLSVNVRASADFRELVLFTPPHGQAVCLEPYTCPTDAVNLQARRQDVGWRVLPPGGRWNGNVEMMALIR